MKRWVILLGRGGTVVLAIGLAMLLVSFIPPISPGQTSGYTGTFTLYPKRWQDWYGGIMTPQQILQISITANGTSKINLLETSSQTIHAWIKEHHPEAIEIFNVTYFDEFLQAVPNSIAWQDETQAGTIEHEYIPTKVTNTTLVLSNPTQLLVRVDYSAFTSTQIAPTGKVRPLAMWAIPLGLVLALPWGVQQWRSKRRR